MGCCGDYSTQPINQQVFDPNSPLAPSLIRIEFIGTSGGVKTYPGFENRQYRFGNNLQNKYVDIHPDDLSKFKARPDLFRIIPPPVVTPPEIVEGVITEIIEPETMVYVENGEFLDKPTPIRQRSKRTA